MISFTLEFSSASNEWTVYMEIVYWLTERKNSKYE